jgi:hypothetical protein
MPIYHRLGDIPKKRHTVFRRPDGGLYAEELMGHEGFVGTSSLLYHTYPPTTVKSAKKIREIRWEADDDTSLRHRHFPDGAREEGRESDDEPHPAAVQFGDCDAVRRAGRARRALLPELASR